jgi:hypothetical protein
MTTYDTIVSMGTESIDVPRMSSAWSSRWWWKGMGSPTISQYGKVNNGIHERRLLSLVRSVYRKGEGKNYQVGLEK